MKRSSKKATSKSAKIENCPECGKKMIPKGMLGKKYPQFKNRTIAQIAEETGIAMETLRNRLRTYPDITYKELTKPVSWSRQPLLIKGKTITEIAEESGLPRNTIKARLQHNPDISYKDLVKPRSK